MKKAFFTLAALAVVSFTQAQQTDTVGGFSKGDAFISGNVSYGTQKTDDFKQSSFTVAPMVGYFVSNNIAIGGSVAYTSGKNEGGSTETTSNSLNIGAFGRYYFMPSNQFSVFAQLQAGYLTRKNETEGGSFSEEYKENGFAAGFGPGVNYWLSDKFALETFVGFINYSSTEPDVDNAEATNRFNIGLNLSNVTFGLIYKF